MITYEPGVTRALLRVKVIHHVHVPNRTPLQAGPYMHKPTRHFIILRLE